MSYFDGYAQGPVNAEVRATCKILADYSATKIDGEGMHVMQLHTAMRVFGGENIGFTQGPFENFVMTVLR